MDITKTCLQLFLQSLPPGCQFEVVSFGSDYRCLTTTAGHKGRTFEFNEDSLEYAKGQVDNFSADMGGTVILDPL